MPSSSFSAEGARQKDAGPALGFREFVAIMAGLMALNALSIDPMLPALPAMGEALRIADPNSRQWIITSYFLGLGVGSMVYGPLSDRYGRKPVLLVCLGIFLFATLGCALAASFNLMLIARFVAGFFAAGVRVVLVSVVRDRFEGDEMAKVMSLIFIVFMIVPVLAPSFGQLVLYAASWRWIFGALLVIGVLLGIWTGLRLPETLIPGNRVNITLSDMKGTLIRVLSHRQALGYMIATGVIMSSMIAFLTSVQQVFFDIFDAEEVFAFAFAGMAGAMAVGSFFNARLVERVGARRLSQGSLVAFIILAAIHFLVAWMGWESLWSFMLFQGAMMLCFSFTGANFSAISMEPFARGAGLAASFQASLTTVISALLGSLVGSYYNGTTVPFATGLLIFGTSSLLIVAWAERWRLFTRRHRPATASA